MQLGINLLIDRRIRFYKLVYYVFCGDFLSSQGPPADQVISNDFVFTIESIGGKRNDLTKLIVFPKSFSTLTKLVFRTNACHWVCFNGFWINDALKASGVPAGRGVLLRLKVF
jgi:hypothetical protein